MGCPFAGSYSFRNVQFLDSFSIETRELRRNPKFVVTFNKAINLEAFLISLCWEEMEHGWFTMSGVKKCLLFD